MRAGLHSIVHKKMQDKDKLYGTTTMGARGQVVIPAQARKDLKLKPGDHLLVIGKLGKALGLIKADQLGELIEAIMDNLAGSGMEKDFKSYIKDILGRSI